MSRATLVLSLLLTLTGTARAEFDASIELAGADAMPADKSGQGADHHLEWHPAPGIVPEGSRMASVAPGPDPEDTARLDAAHAEIRTMPPAR